MHFGDVPSVTKSVTCIEECPSVTRSVTCIEECPSVTRSVTCLNRDTGTLLVTKGTSPLQLPLTTPTYTV